MTDAPSTDRTSIMLPCKCGKPAVCERGRDLRFDKEYFAYVAQCSMREACSAPTFSRETHAQAVKAWNRERIFQGADFTLAAWHGSPGEPSEKPVSPTLLMASRAELKWELAKRGPDPSDELERYGRNHNRGPHEPLLEPMPDGYWTPWHLADAALRVARITPEPSEKPIKVGDRVDVLYKGQWDECGEVIAVEPLYSVRYKEGFVSTQPAGKVRPSSTKGA